VTKADTSVEQRQEIERLRLRLQEAEEALRAIRGGEVDALVVYSGDSERIYTLEGADHTYRTLIESIHEGAATLDGEGAVLYCNRRLADMLGVAHETMMGASLLDYLPELEKEDFLRLSGRGMHGSARGEFTFLCAEKPPLPVLLSFGPVEVEDDLRISMVATDLTEQKRNQEILAAERMARSILEQAAEAIVVCDERGVIIRASSAAFGLLQRSPLYQNFDDVFKLSFEDCPINDTPRPFSMKAVLAGEPCRGVEACLEPPSPLLPGSGAFIRRVLVSASPLINDSGKLLGSIITLTDVTRLREAEIEQRERMAQEEVQHRLLNQREQERQQIARDLHDGPIQDLMVLIFQIHAAAAMQADEEAHNRLMEIRAGAQKLVADLRQVCNELRPPSLVQFGLSRAILSHIEDIQSHPGVLHLDPGEEAQVLPRIILELVEGDVQLAADVRLAVYRIFQQSLINALRHAQAGSISVRLKVERTNLEMEVTDDGVGFIAPGEWLSLAREGHLGLVGMQERARAMGGQLSISSQPGKGTQILLQIPLTDAMRVHKGTRT